MSVLWYELRMLVAAILMGWAYGVMPEGEERAALLGFLGLRARAEAREHRRSERA